MMDFIMVPLIMWICVSGVYSLFELFVRRKERMFLIEKYGLNAPVFNGKFRLPNVELPDFASHSFGGLKIGFLLVGLGLGLLVGLMISTELVSDGYNYDNWRDRETFGLAYAASVLLFGGIGLITSFLIETRVNRKRRDQEARRFNDPEIQ
jgi:hypothetical protein